MLIKVNRLLTLGLFLSLYVIKMFLRVALRHFGSILLYKLEIGLGKI